MLEKYSGASYRSALHTERVADEGLHHTGTTTSYIPQVSIQDPPNQIQS
jgi:hypothetical protein